MDKALKLVAIIVIFAVLLVPNTIFAKEITGHYAAFEIRSLIKEEIMVGNEIGQFLPDGKITRAEFTMLIVKAMNLKPSTNKPLDFIDVDSSKWYSDSIKIASSHEIVSGDGKGNFKPLAKITRQEMATMIKRTIDLVPSVTLEKVKLQFEDNSTIQDWALSDIQHLTSVNIIAGESINNKLYFSPMKDATRGQAAAFTYRMLHVIDPVKYPAEEKPPASKTTKYNYPFKQMVDAQTNSTPKVDGAGRYTASEASVSYYVNPSNFNNDPVYKYQFLVLSHSAGVTANELNKKFLHNKGSLKDTGAAFIEAGNTHRVNELYLMTHAFHETGNGKSTLANGIEVGLNKDKKPEMVTSSNRENLTAIKKTYNMFGVQAFDSCPLECGSQHAYSQGWFTPHAAIVGGATFISNRYIDQGQDTLYKMRWNPESKISGVLGRQYATHVQWATIQAKKMHDMYKELESYTISFDIPAFNSQPGPSNAPTGVNVYAVLDHKEIVAWTTANPLNFRQGPTTGFNLVEQRKTLPYNTKVSIIGHNGGWFKIKAGNDVGWVSGNYLSFTALPKTASFSIVESTDENVIRKELEQHIDTTFGVIASDSALVYENQDLSVSTSHELPMDSEVKIVDSNNDAYHIVTDEIDGWISKEVIDLLD